MDNLHWWLGDYLMNFARHPVGRYAPSPTGELHLGNLRTALTAHADIRGKGGTFILRVEDADLPRNVAGASQRILDDLRWLGIDWDEGPDVGGPAGPYLQSRREDIYRQYLTRLFDSGLIYVCTCSRRDVQQSAASAPHGMDGPVYAGTCRERMGQADSRRLMERLTRADRNTDGRTAEGCIRLRTDILDTAEFTDETHGEFSVDLARDVGDFVVFRRDGLWAYQFVCAVDDALMGITRVVRGEDLLTSTARQVAIIDALGFQVPVYRHIPLVADDITGERLSKRDGSQGLSSLRKRGFTRDDVLELIASLTDVRLTT